MKTPLTKERVKYHFSYNQWKYLVLILVSIIGWNLIYTMTAYRPPEDKKVDFYISFPYADSAALDEFMQKAWDEVLPDMEQVTAVTLLGTSDDDMYGTMQLGTYIAAGEGDVYMLAANDFQSYASGGGMLSLDDYVQSGQLDTGDLAVESGYVTLSDTDERHLYGIPCDELEGFRQLGIDPGGMYLCILATSGNDENCVKLVQYLIEQMGETN